jgi:hypothetical protein
MDEARSPTPSGGMLPRVAEASSWRLPDSHGGAAPDPSAARRSAAFAVFVVSALRRTQARRF